MVRILVAIEQVETELNIFSITIHPDEYKTLVGSLDSASLVRRATESTKTIDFAHAASAA